jgi:hypothetical protein
MHPIADKAEVAIDFPDKFYVGGFGRDCVFEARAEADGVLIRLVCSEGEKRAVEIHLHHYLLAGILDDLAQSLAGREPIDEPHRQKLLDAARNLVAGLEKTQAGAGTRYSRQRGIGRRTRRAGAGLRKTPRSRHCSPSTPTSAVRIRHIAARSCGCICSCASTALDDSPTHGTASELMPVMLAGNNPTRRNHAK